MANLNPQDILNALSKVGETATGTLKKQAKAVGTDSPIALLAQLIGTASVPPAQDLSTPRTQQASQGASKQTQQASQTKAGSTDTIQEQVQLTPTQELIRKETEKRKKEVIAQQLDAGVPEADLMGFAANKDAQDTISALSQSLATGQPPANQGALDTLQSIGRFLIDPGQTQPGQEFRMPSALGGLIRPSASNQLLLQEQAGQKPLQKGEREKIEIAQFNNLLQTGSKALSSEAATKLGNIESGLQQVGLLEEAFAQDPNVFKQLVTPGNASAQSIQVVVEDLSDILGRLRSGGAISKEEETRFRKQIPKFGFIQGRLESGKAVQFKLQKLRNLFTTIQQNIKPPSSGMSQSIQSALQAGFSREEIMNRLKARGQI